MEVLVVDDHPIIHETLRVVVAAAMPGATVHAAFDLAGGMDLAIQVKSLQLVLLDLGLPDCSGIETLVRFRRAVPGARVAIISATEDRACILDSLAAGAAGFLPKSSRPAILVAALRLIAEGGIYLPAQTLSAPAPFQPAMRIGGAGNRLTGRQADVLRLLVRGLANRQIAVQLEISENTVKQHAHTLFAVLGVSSRAEAVVAAARLGLRPD